MISHGCFVLGSPTVLGRIPLLLAINMHSKKPAATIILRSVTSHSYQPHINAHHIHNVLWLCFSYIYNDLDIANVSCLISVHYHLVHLQDAFKQMSLYLSIDDHAKENKFPYKSVNDCDYQKSDQCKKKTRQV